MLSFIHTLFKSKSSINQTAIDNTEAENITKSIISLEQTLQKDETNQNTQKALMLEYNKALKVYSNNPNYKHKVDELFIKIDELRNVTRKNF